MTNGNDQDRAEIERLMTRYASAIDRGDFAGIGELFADGTWNGRVGAAACEEHVAQTINLYGDGTPRTAHLISNLTIDIAEDDTAAAGSTIAVYQQTDFGADPCPIACADCCDTFWKPRGAWAFKTREIALRFGQLNRHLRDSSHLVFSAPIAPGSDTASASGAREPPRASTSTDYETIRRMNIEYARRIDTGDLAGFAALFADGVWNNLDGSEAVREWLERWVLLYEGTPKTAHLVSNLDIEVDGDRATSHCIITVLQMVPGMVAPTTITVNDYDDVYERIAAGWVWRRRDIRRRLVGDTSRHRSGPPDWH